MTVEDRVAALVKQADTLNGQDLKGAEALMSADSGLEADLRELMATAKRARDRGMTTKMMIQQSGPPRDN